MERMIIVNVIPRNDERLRKGKSRELERRCSRMAEVKKKKKERKERKGENWNERWNGRLLPSPPRRDLLEMTVFRMIGRDYSYSRPFALAGERSVANTVRIGPRPRFIDPAG